MLNDAQLDYLSDECQDINRMMCFKTFLRMALMEPTKVSKKHFSADLQPGQFEASKVELAMMWRCNRKTATRIIREFNLMGILSSEPSNRTTIHTLRCLSVWFTDQRMVKNSFFVSHPVVKPIEKPTRTAAHVPLWQAKNQTKRTSLFRQIQVRHQRSILQATMEMPSMPQVAISMTIPCRPIHSQQL